MTYSLLKNAGMVPEEITLLQEMASLRERLNSTVGEAERDVLRKMISNKQMEYNLLMERRKR